MSTVSSSIQPFKNKNRSNVDFALSLFRLGNDNKSTYAKDGTIPIMLNPTPKTSHGVKLRRNSKALILHQYPSKRIRSFVLRNFTPCLYPSLANSAASWA